LYFFLKPAAEPIPFLFQIETSYWKDVPKKIRSFRKDQPERI